MKSVSVLQAKSSFSRLVEAIESGRESEVLIERDGHPVAKLVPVGCAPDTCRIGVARGKFNVPDDIDRQSEEVAQLVAPTVM